MLMEHQHDHSTHSLINICICGAKIMTVGFTQNVGSSCNDPFQRVLGISQPNTPILLKIQHASCESISLFLLAHYRKEINIDR